MSAEKLDWDKVQDAYYGTDDPDDFELSLGGIKLVLTLLQRANFRGAWVVSGAPPSDGEWDTIQGFVSETVSQLMP